MKRVFGGIKHPWNAFQSAFAEHPFDAFAMTKSQVAMFYYTIKDHLSRHVTALTARPTGSLWDYVPEPRLHAAQPLINDIRAGVRSSELVTETCSARNAPGPGQATQPAEAGVTDLVNEDCDDTEGTLQCLGCGQLIKWIMHRDDTYACMDCRAGPFHIKCLESHYEQAHPRPQQAFKEEERAKENEILHRESEEARSLWANHMTNLSKSATPLNYKIISMMAVFASVGLAVGPFWTSTAADAPAALLQ